MAVSLNTKKIAGSVSVGALALMVVFSASHEGEVRHTYVDKAGRGGNVLSYCYGATEGAKLGQKYTHQECLASLHDQALKHATEVQACLPEALPDSIAAAFYDLGYNIGAPAFCKSSIARKAKAHDLRGACKAINLYVYSNGKDCRDWTNNCHGIAQRRQDEVTLCLNGLK